MTGFSFNYYMNDIQAALGLTQLGKLDGFMERRREIAALYNEQLKGTESGWHLYMIQLDSEVLTKSRREIFDDMRARNIGVHVHYIPVYWQPYYQDLGYELGLCLAAESWYPQTLTLPVFPGMTDGDVGAVVNALKEVVG